MPTLRLIQVVSHLDKVMASYEYYVDVFPALSMRKKPIELLIDN